MSKKELDETKMFQEIKKQHYEKVRTRRKLNEDLRSLSIQIDLLTSRLNNLEHDEDEEMFRKRQIVLCKQRSRVRRTIEIL